MDERQAQVVSIPAFTFFAMLNSLNGGQMVNIEGLPDDVVMGECGYNPIRQEFTMILRNLNFPLVPDGEEIPAMPLTVRYDKFGTPQLIFAPVY